MTNAEIEAFLTISNERNISLAARKLFISQSSLSLRIKALEHELSCSLFNRSRGKHEVTLTSDGEKFLDLALQYKQILSSMAMLGKSNTVLRIAAVNSISSFLITEVCEKFMCAYPNIALEVHDLEKTDEICKWIENGQTDLALACGNVHGRKLRSFPLFREKMEFICSEYSSYPQIVGIDCLNPKNEIYVNWFVDFIQWHSETFNTHGCHPIFVSNMTQLRKFLSQPNRWAFVPSTVTEGLISAGFSITKKELSFEIPNRTIYLLFPLKPTASSAADLFLNEIKKHIQAKPEITLLFK
jgi:hypothetical protein